MGLLGLFAVLGVVIALLFAGFINGLEMILIPIVVGGFIYIAGSDLIPELHKETQISKSLLQLLAFIAGIFVMILLLVFG